MKGFASRRQITALSGDSKATGHLTSMGGMYQAFGGYPESVKEVLDNRLRFRKGLLPTMRKFAKQKPWRGTMPERIAKLDELLTKLSAIYGIQKPTLITDALRDDATDSSSSFYFPAFREIHLRGKYSVLTFLHEFAHALGKGEWQACRWSLNLFRRVFPKQFARCQHDGHTLRAPRR